jgi:hypothetical protein
MNKMFISVDKDVEKVFKLTKSDMEKIKNFHPECKSIYTGAIGGGETFSFTPTGLGMIITYKCRCGDVLDLTEYDSW